MTIKHALNFLKESRTGKYEQKTIYWITDSENLVALLTKVSVKTHIQKEVLGVLKTARELKLAIIPVRLRREDPRVEIADRGSKSYNSDDWSINKSSFEELRNRFREFTVDLFADETNKKVAKFYSEYFSPTSAGTDAFVQDWTYENCWICPPVKYIIRIIRKIKAIKCKGVLIVPDRHTA